MRLLYQLNLQQQFGGGEVYTHFLCQALGQLQVPHSLLIHQDAKFWDKFNLPHTRLHPVQPHVTEISSTLQQPSVLLTHGAISTEWRKALQDKGHQLFGIAHMPLYGRNPKVFDGYDGVIGVSQYVINSLRDAGVNNIYPHAWYGVATLDHRQQNHEPIVKNSRYDWDKRKGRDRLLAWLEPFYTPLRAKPNFYTKPGLTLGIVSRITPIKQFPLLFQHIAPLLAAFPEINLEIFGSGGYASVRDLKQELRPIANQTRWWGHQHNIAGVYEQLDFLLTGLPEKEALGLNVIEAQACNLPVLAVDALPFQETVLNNQTGYLFTDPRQDNGVHLQTLLQNLLNGSLSHPQPLLARTHLQQFSNDAFKTRVEQTLAWMGI